MSRIRIISDLHWGHKASLLKDPGALRPLLEGADLVVLNGDSVEEKYGSTPQRKRLPLPSSADLRHELDRIGIPYLILPGNHDPLISDRQFLEIGDILITHGDGSFPEIAPWSQQAKQLSRHLQSVNAKRPATELEDFLRNLKRAAIETQKDESDYDPTVWGKLQIFLRAAWPPNRPFRILSCWKLMPQATLDTLRRYGKSPRIAIVGHTHRPGITQIGSSIVINTGSFFPWPGAACVEVSESGLEVRRIRKRPDAFALGPKTAEFVHPKEFDPLCIDRAVEQATASSGSRQRSQKPNLDSRKIFV